MQTNIYTIDTNITLINKDLIIKINKFKIYNNIKKYINLKKYDNDFSVDINLYNDLITEISSLYKDKEKRVDFSKIKYINGFNFSVIDDYIYNTCNIILKQGFYPYLDMNISVAFINTLKKKSDINKELCFLLESDIKRLKSKMLKVFKNHKNIINNIYKLYYKYEYRACILMIINLLNILYNDIYRYIGLDDEKVKMRLLDIGMFNNNQKNFIEFSPYILDNNYILKSDKNYNLFNISRGYSDKYATKINTLRYFSVLLNTMNLFEIYI